jgi:uroporphyrin-3 C-methyltransferase
MSEQKTPELPALTSPPPAAPSDKTAGDGYRAIALWLAVLALLGVTVLGWLAWQDRGRIETTRQDLSRRLADAETAQRDAQGRSQQNRETIDALQAKVGALEARLAEIQSQQMALETIYQELSRVREDRLLAEIEQDVAIAAQQLQLAGNVEAALIALRGAEARLARSAQPQFLPLRTLIARDIERLKALPGADVSGIALKLDGILNAAGILPLAYEQRPLPDSQETAAPSLADGASAAVLPVSVTNVDWQGMARRWLADLWQELRQLVRIERIDRPDPGLLAPRETFFLRENLRLRLLSARLALLARDNRSFQADLQQAGIWLERYFDTRAPAVEEARATLKELGRLDVVRVLPGLDETLAAVRNFKLSRDRGDRGMAR